MLFPNDLSISLKPRFPMADLPLGKITREFMRLAFDPAQCRRAIEAMARDGTIFE